MDPLLIIGLWAVILLGIAGVVRAARCTTTERNFDDDHEEPFARGGWY